MSRRDRAPDRATNPARTPQLAALCVFAAAMSVYLRTVHTGLPGPDSGELISVARVLGIGRPPGYPIYTLLAHAFGAIVPWGGYAWRLNLLSALLHASAAAVLCLSVCRLTGRTDVCRPAVGPSALSEV